MPQYYDYIITGAGCAGLSLLRRMMLHSYFTNKKILLIDKAEKNTNDRTWCFWEKDSGLFEDIVYYRWRQIDFYTNEFAARYDINPYEYKMIRGIDLYTTVLNEAGKHLNVEIIYDEVTAVASDENAATVKTVNNIYQAAFVFNSLFLYDWKQQALQQKNVHVLLQHFKGWMIETRKNVFDDRIATFMDFRISQEQGSAFVYTLPVAKNMALIEYTLFSENLLSPEQYDAALNSYILQQLKISKYKLLHAEYGIIPMTNFNFSKGEGKIINTGTAGGQTKGSSGYTFQFIQKHSAKIIEALVQEKNPLHVQSVFEKRFRLYDGILLNVLKNKKMSGDKLFAQLFKNNRPQAVLKFLDNETTLKEELKIMNSVSLNVFLPAALKQII